MKVPYTKSGKRGNTVWQRNRYGPISYAYFIPANPQTPAQIAVRGSFGAVSKRWRALTEDQRVRWCDEAKNQRTRRRLGQRWPLKGFYYFVRINVALVNRGLPQVDLPPVDASAPKPSGQCLSHILFLQARHLLPESPQIAPEFANRAPRTSG